MLFASSDDAFRSEAYCLMLASGLLCSSDKQRNPATSSSSALVLESRSAVCFFLAVARADSTDTTATSTPNKKDRFLKTGELMTSLVHCQSPSHTNRSLMHKKWRPKPPFCQNSWLASSEALVVVARDDDVDVFHNSLLFSLKNRRVVKAAARSCRCIWTLRGGRMRVRFLPSLCKQFLRWSLVLASASSPMTYQHAVCSYVISR